MYAHLNKILVKKGQSINALEKVALSGNTGLSTSGHLHYSIWEGDKLIDPIQFVDLPFSEQVKNEINF